MEILPFDGNLRELSQMIARSWPREHRTYIDYSAEFLRHLMEYPCTDIDLTLGAYYRGKLICFIFSAQIAMTINDRRYKVLLNSLATTDPDYEHLFPYLKLKAHCVKRAIASGYELNVGYAVQGITNNRIEMLYARKNGFQFLTVGPFGSLTYTLDGGMNPQQEWGLEDLRIRPYQDTDVSECLSVMQRQNRHLKLRQERDEASLRYKLSYPEIRHTEIIASAGSVIGFINYGVANFRYPNFKRRIMVIDNFFIDALPQNIRRDVLRQFLNACHEMDLDGISLPDTGYFDPLIAREEGFRKIPFQASQAQLFLTLYRGSIELPSDAAFYLEIL